MLLQLLEDFIWKALDLLGKLDQLREHLMCPELPDNLNGAKMMLEDHNHLKKRVVKAPIESLDAEGQKILDQISRSTGLSRTGEKLHVLVGKKGRPWLSSRCGWSLKPEVQGSNHSPGKFSLLIPLCLVNSYG